MNCNKCGGRVFLDRVFVDNKSYELYCLICGARRFESKGSLVGQWLTQKERERKAASGL